MPETTPATCPTDASAPQVVDNGPCPACAHPDCRTRRAARQPRLRGHTAEFVAEHRTAAAVQARHPGVVVWFGEATQSYWAAAPAGLIEAPDIDALLLGLWRPAHGGGPAGPPQQVTTTGPMAAVPA